MPSPVTPRAAVLGHPISHSKSPQLHLAAYRALGLSADYARIDQSPATLGAFMESVSHAAGWMGLSVTMPLKSAMVEYVDSLSGAAAQLGVLNTVVVNADESRTGYNTDVRGIVNAVLHASGRPSVHGAHGVSPLGTRAAVLGGGGTSAAAIAALAEMGHRSVVVFVRDASRAEEASRAAAATGVELSLLPFAEAAALLPGFDLVISTLPPRAADTLAPALAQGQPLGQGALLLDVAYDPWPSALAASWQEAGGLVVPGLEMLLYQAVEQVLLFTGSDAELAPRVIDVMCASVGAPER